MMKMWARYFQKEEKMKKKIRRESVVKSTTLLCNSRHRICVLEGMKKSVVYFPSQTLQNDSRSLLTGKIISSIDFSATLTSLQV